MTRAEGRVHRTALCIILAALCGAVSVGASEPDGAIAFRPVWVESDRPVRDAELHGAGAELRLTFESYVDLSDATLVLRFDDRLDVALFAAEAVEEIERTVAPDGTTALRLPVGELARGRAGVVPLRCRILEGTGSVLHVEIHGSSREGRTHRDAFGIPIGLNLRDHERRHGAIEFRAVPVAPPDDAGDRP